MSASATDASIFSASHSSFSSDSSIVPLPSASYFLKMASTSRTSSDFHSLSLIWTFGSGSGSSTCTRTRSTSTPSSPELISMYTRYGSSLSGV